jgi:type I restriction enzyme S subunit
VPAYGSYRDSEVEWLGGVPSDWAISKFRHRFRESPEKIDDEVIGPMLSVSGYRGIEIKDYDDENRRRSDEELIGYRIVRRGQLVVNTMWLNYAGLGVSEHEGHVSPAYRAYWFQPGLHARYAHHLLRSGVYVQGYTSYLTGIRPNSLQMGRDSLMEFPIVVPPPAEQVAIATFLDRETGKIDALVEAQRRLIDLLKEKRQAVISHAVTKGLDPTVPTKDSGVEWLGEVPAHWLVTPIRKAARLESGHTPSRSRPDWWEDCTIPWFSLADVWQIREAKRDYIFDTKELVSELGLENSSARLLPAGTVMLSRTASVGFSAIMGVAMATTQDFANWICGPRLDPGFLLQVLRAMTGEFKRLMMGSTHNTIYMPDIQSLTMVLPPPEEQVAIIEHVKDLSERYNELTKQAEAAITLLQERRAALISAAVTGKIDVRGLVPAEAEAA